MIRKMCVALVLGAALVGCDGAEPAFGTDVELEELDRVRGSCSCDATSVQLVRPSVGGSVEVIATATVDAAGQFVLWAPRRMAGLVVQALDVSGEVVAAVIVEQSGAPHQDVACGPMDTETTIEAAVWLATTAHAAVVANPVDVRERIDLTLALAVAASADVEAAVHDLAIAVLVAQRAEVEAWASFGISTSQHAMARVEASASAALTAALLAGRTTAQATETFHARLQAAALQLGGTAEECAEVALEAAAAFELAAQATIEDTTVLEAALVASARLEARASAWLMSELVSSSAFADAAVDAAVDATIELRTSVLAAADLHACADAWAEFEAEITGSGSCGSCVMDEALELSLLSELTVDVALNAAVIVAATLDTTLHATTDLALDAAGEIDISALAQLVVHTWTEWHGTIDLATHVLLLTSAQAELASELIVVGQGGLATCAM